jgi:hypothetical protein
MNCFECAIHGETVAAVGTCHHCGVGLCLEHLHAAQDYRVGGTFYGCPHDLTALPPSREAVVGAGRANGHLHSRVAR